jgi:hypothetical protein
LYANGASGWYDAYFPNFIYVGGKVYGTPGTSLVVKNQGGTVLHPSDLVRIAGFDPVGLDAETPTLLVAGTGGANAVGVVYGAYVHDEEFTRLFAEEGGPVVDPPVPEGEEPAAVLPAAEDAGDTLEADGWHVVEGPVQPGQYALMITEGFVQMNLSAAHPVEVGELLVTTPNGSVMAAAGPEVMSTLGPDQAIIGRALEPLETGSGKIWVYVSFR